MIIVFCFCVALFFFFFNDTATTEIYTLSLHDALPIFTALLARRGGTASRIDLLREVWGHSAAVVTRTVDTQDRKSTRLNSSHANISYAVFCLKKKKNQITLL